jgi:hypothetical protein
VLVAPRDDTLGQGWAYPRQPRDLTHVSVIDVNVVTRQQGTGELCRAARSFLKPVRP